MVTGAGLVQEARYIAAAVLRVGKGCLVVLGV